MFLAPLATQTPSSHGETQLDEADDPATPPRPALALPTFFPPLPHPPSTKRSPPLSPRKCARSSPPDDSEPTRNPSPPCHSPKVFLYREKAPLLPINPHPPLDRAAPTPSRPATSEPCDRSILPASRGDSFSPPPPASTSPHTFPRPDNKPSAASDPEFPPPTPCTAPKLSGSALSAPLPHQKMPPPHSWLEPERRDRPHSAHNHSAQKHPRAPDTPLPLRTGNTRTRSNPKTCSTPSSPFHRLAPPAKTAFHFVPSAPALQLTARESHPWPGH